MGWADTSASLYRESLRLHLDLHFWRSASDERRQALHLLLRQSQALPSPKPAVVALWMPLLVISAAAAVGQLRYSSTWRYL